MINIERILQYALIHQNEETKQRGIEAVSIAAQNTCKEYDLPIGKISDGYHTFDELYEHRIAIFRALCEVKYVDFKTAFSGKMVWKSLSHSDGSKLDGWFIAGIGTHAGEQITYHIPIAEYQEWPANTLSMAPEFDGHTSADVLKRLREL